MRQVRWASVWMVVWSIVLQALTAAGDPTTWQQRYAEQEARDAALAALPRTDRYSLDDAGQLAHLAGRLGWIRPDAPPDAVLAGFLERFGPLLRARGAERYTHVRSVRDAHGQLHMRARQWLGTVPVVGGDLALHFDAASGELIGFDASFLPRAPAELAPPRVPAPLALLAARSLSTGALPVAPGELVYLNLDGHRGALTWAFTLADPTRAEPWCRTVYVDADDGTVRHSETLVVDALDRRLWSAGFGTELQQTFLFGESPSCTPSAPCDGDALLLRTNLGTTYDYFSAVWGLDSFDDAGKPINATIHYRVGYNNAFYVLDQDWLVFGDGGSGLYLPLGRSLDVVAHEYTHGVAKHLAGLGYGGETAAVNESFADVFAARAAYFRDGTITSDTWRLAEDVFTPSTPGDAVRYLDDPADDGASLDHYPDYAAAPGTDPHRASGIANLALYLLANGGSHPRGKTAVTVPALGFASATAIWQNALEVDVLATETYAQLRTHTAAAAARLQGASAADAVHWAWDAVGVPGSPHVAPGTPATIQHFTEHCYGMYSVNWTAGAGPGAAARYKLQFAPTTAFTGASLLYDGPDLSRVVNLPASGYLRVRGCNAYGCSGWRVSNYAEYYDVCQ